MPRRQALYKIVHLLSLNIFVLRVRNIMFFTLELRFVSYGIVETKSKERRVGDRGPVLRLSSLTHPSDRKG